MAKKNAERVNGIEAVIADMRRTIAQHDEAIRGLGLAESAELTKMQAGDMGAVQRRLGFARDKAQLIAECGELEKQIALLTADLATLSREAKTAAELDTYRAQREKLAEGFAMLMNDVAALEQIEESRLERWLHCREVLSWIDHQYRAITGSGGSGMSLELIAMGCWGVWHKAAAERRILMGDPLVPKCPGLWLPNASPLAASEYLQFELAKARDRLNRFFVEQGIDLDAGANAALTVLRDEASTEDTTLLEALR